MKFATGMLLLFSSLVQAQEPVQLRTELGNKGPVWVGQRTSVYVTVLMAERPSASPRFTLPEVEGALFRQAPGSPVVGSLQVDGAPVTTQRFELMLFPQRSGTIAIPAVDVRVRLSGELYELASEAMEFSAKLPEGVEPGTPLITTTSLDIRQSWSPEPVQLTVGDAFRRTITIRAKDVLAVAIPPAPVPRPEGLAAYEGGTTVDDKIQRGALNSTRTDEVTYVCTRAGSFELPELVYRWWDPEARVLKEQRLPGVRFTALPDPLAASSARALTDEDGISSDALGWGAALVGALALMGYLARRPIARHWNSWNERREASEAAYFGRFERAARSADRALTWDTLTAWMDCAVPTASTCVALEFASRNGSPELEQAVQSLQLALLSPARDWNPDGLLRSTKQTRQVLLAVRKSRTPALPDLN